MTVMNNKTGKLTSIILKGGMATLLLFMLCIFLKPAGLGANDGLSYYGTFRSTIVPYSLAFFTSAYAYWQLAEALSSRQFSRHFTLLVRAMAVLCVGLVITPHTLVESLHMAIGATLFCVQLGSSVWLSVKWHDNVMIAWLIMEVVSGLLALHYLPTTHGLLLQAQVLYQIAFAALLLCSVRRADRSRPVAVNTQ